jgi:hypothetical protein
VHHDYPSIFSQLPTRFVRGPADFDALTKVPQVFRNPGGSPALHNEDLSAADIRTLLFQREDINRMAGGYRHALLTLA